MNSLTFLVFSITNAYSLDSNHVHELIGLENVAIVIGGNATFTCLHNLPNASSAAITWYYSPFDFNKAATRGKLAGNSSEYRMKNLTNGQSLSIDSNHIHNAGIYTCQSLVKHNDTGNTHEIGAYLILFVSDPACVIDKTIANETDIINIQCSVKYSGYWDPFISCRRMISNTSEEIDNKAVQINLTASNNIKTRSLVASIHLESQQQSMHMECDTFFSSINLSKGFATNVPNYKYTWTSSQIRVLYGARNITVVPIRDVLYPGEYLSCYALGNPEPEIEWINLETAEIIPGTTLHIPTSMICQRNHTFLCRAKNSLSEVSKEILFSVKNPHRDDFEVIKRTISITVAVCIVTIVLLAVLGCMFRKYKTGKAPLQEETGRQNNELDAYIAFNRSGTVLEESEYFYAELKHAEQEVNSNGTAVDFTDGTEYEQVNDVVGDISTAVVQPSNQSIYANVN